MTKLPFSVAWQIKPVPPYSFKLTVRKPAGWSLFSNFEVYEDEMIWSATSINGMLVGFKLASEGTTSNPRLQAEMFLRKAPSDQQERYLKRVLEHDIGADEDLRPFYAMAKDDDILAHTIRDLRGMHNTSQSTIFPDAALSILLQMAPLKRSDEMMGCYIRNYGELADFDGKKVFAWPVAERMAGLDPEVLGIKCKLGYRAKRIVLLAKSIVENDFPDMEGLESLGAEEARRKLLELPGIGEYSADIINPHGGFPIDVWSADVFGLLLFGKEPEEKRKEISRIRAEGIKRWGEWSWMAFFYVVQDLENLSRALNLRLRLS
jgi:3-methyladenine DNA glycosylase/8-oxoguanine DNA glycosylase